MVDMSHQSVTRWEVKLAASLQAACRAFHEPFYQPAAVDRFTMHSFSSDATNTSIWQQAKLHGLFLTTVAVEGVDIENLPTSTLAQCCRSGCLVQVPKVEASISLLSLRPPSVTAFRGFAQHAFTCINTQFQCLDFEGGSTTFGPTVVLPHLKSKH